MIRWRGGDRVRLSLIGSKSRLNWDLWSKFIVSTGDLEDHQHSSLLFPPFPLLRSSVCLSFCYQIMSPTTSFVASDSQATVAFAWKRANEPRTNFERANHERARGALPYCHWQKILLTRSVQKLIAWSSARREKLWAQVLLIHKEVLIMGNMQLNSLTICAVNFFRHAIFKRNMISCWTFGKWKKIYFYIFSFIFFHVGRLEFIFWKEKRFS